jgi:hypothetical protein
MKKITVGYFGHHKERLEIHKVAFHYIKKIKPENKEKIQFNLLYNQDDEHWQALYEDITKAGIQATLKKFPAFFPDGNVDNWNYLKKCLDTASHDTEFSCKMDEDIWISNYAWDWIIENIDAVLDDPGILTMTPIITNGIPTTELFIDNVLTTEEQNKVREIFYNYTIGDWWDVDYSLLKTIRDISPKWDAEKFFQLAGKIPHHYKGVHPVRFSFEAQTLINDLAIKHYDRISEPQDYNGLYLDKPAYMCNTFYFIKTQTWRQILSDKTLFRDGMDEVPLNLYRERHNLNFAYINNIYCVHVLYNSIKDHGLREQEIIEKFKKIIV